MAASFMQRERVVQFLGSDWGELRVLLVGHRLTPGPFEGFVRIRSAREGDPYHNSCTMIR